MKLTFFFIMLSLVSSLVRCQNQDDLTSPIYKNNFGELNYILPDSIKFTSTNGWSKTVYLDKSMRAKNMILYKDLMLYADYGVLFAFDFSNERSDTVIKSESFIYANELLVYGNTLVVYNTEKLLIIDMISKEITNEFVGDFSNAELEGNRLFYSATENHTETGVYLVDLNTNTQKKLLTVPSHTFSYGNYYEEGWRGMKVIVDNLFVHIGNNIYVIDLSSDDFSVIKFSTKFSGGVVYRGEKNTTVEFEDNGEVIEINMKTKKIERKVK